MIPNSAMMAIFPLSFIANFKLVHKDLKKKKVKLILKGDYLLQNIVQFELLKIKNLDVN